jgi:Fe-S-cluster containining protein
MEFTLDLHLVRRLVADERDRATAEIASEGPLVAYARSQSRHEQRLAEAGDASTLACRAGCSWCCHFTIDVRAVEVFRILDHLATLPATEQQRIRERIAKNAQMVQRLNESERARTNIECAFLNEGRCSIYLARPQTCRNYHATDAAGCQQAFEHPENEDIDPDFAPLVYQSGHAHVEAFANAMASAGYETDVYEMNTALAAALSEPSTRARFLSKVQAFTDLVGFDVPTEFLDEE